MLLYHFTAREYLDAIRAEGLTKGDVPLSPTQGVNAVWLTSDRAPDGHGLSDGYTLSYEQRLAHARAFGWMPPEDARVPNKRAVRITVQVPRGDRNLRHWPKWARRRLDPAWYALLHETGGRKADTWWLYFGIIPPGWFRSVEALANGRAKAAGVRTEAEMAEADLTSADYLGAPAP